MQALPAVRLNFDTYGLDAASSRPTLTAGDGSGKVQTSNTHASQARHPLARGGQGTINARRISEEEMGRGRSLVLHAESKNLVSALSIWDISSNE
jgi:hypothetical protein